MNTKQMPERIAILTPTDLDTVDPSQFYVTAPCPGGKYVVKDTSHDYAEYVRSDVAHNIANTKAPTHIRVTKDSIPVHDICINNKNLRFRVDMNGVDIIEIKKNKRYRFSPLRIFSSDYFTHSIYASFHWFGANGAQFICLNRGELVND